MTTTTVDFAARRLVSVFAQTPGGEDRYDLWFEIEGVDPNWGFAMTTPNWNQYTNATISSDDKFRIDWKIMDHDHACEFLITSDRIAYSSHPNVNIRINNS